MSKRPTINDIAQACGVSLSTVSLVLNNNPRISQKTRDKVLAAVDEYGYQPNEQARALASRSSRSLSVVVPHLNHVFADIYFGEIVSGIYEQATEENYKLLLDVANDTFISNREYINLMHSRRTDAMLFIASSMDDAYLREFEGSKYPFLLVNHFFPDSSLNYVTVDYRETAHRAADHLIELGHQHIGVIAGTNTYTGIQCRDEFINRCEEKGIPRQQVAWVDGGKDWSEEGGFTACRELLEHHSGITAIMAGNDRLAMGAMRCIHNKGLQIPGDISVIGANDIPRARFTTPELTTIHHSLYDLGQLACKRVLAMFRGEETACQEVVPVSLVVRESTGPAKSA